MYGGWQYSSFIQTKLLTPLTAGVDTTLSALLFLLLQLIRHPDVQRRAHMELDSVIGAPDSPLFRLPAFDDRSSLPYIDAIVKESIRYTPPAAAGVPHAVIQEDVYRGWAIPKGSIIIPNAWGMLRDPNVYSDPDTFRPERFLWKGTNPPEPDPGLNGVFGFGKRCVLEWIAST